MFTILDSETGYYRELQRDFMDNNFIWAIRRPVFSEMSIQ